jgi:hypothetical protein
MLLVTQQYHVTFVILRSIVENKKKSLGSIPFTCLSNCYPSFFQSTSLYFPQVIYYSVCTKLGSDWGVNTFLVDNHFGLVDKLEPTAGEYNSKQKGDSVFFRTIRSNSLCDISLSILCVGCYPKFNTCKLFRHRNQPLHKVVISCRIVVRVVVAKNL